MISRSGVSKNINYLNEFVVLRKNGEAERLNFNTNYKIENKRSEEITSKIIKHLKKNMLKDLIKTKYEITYKDEIDKIYKYVIKKFEEKELFIRENLNYKVNNYIKENDYVNLGGFVKFRMKELTEFMSIIVELSIEEYVINRGQEEFVAVLRYFVENQNCKSDYVKVVIDDENSFKLIDDKGNKIDNVQNEDIINLVMRENLNYEDFLISTLLSLCPKKLEITDLIKNDITKNIVEMLKLIFKNRIVNC